MAGIDIDIESEEGAQEKVDAHEELDNPHAASASMADLDDVGGEPVGLDSAEFDEFLQDQESANEMASAPVTMGAVVASPPAMDTVSASETAMDAVSASEIAMDTVSASQTAMDAVSASEMAMDTVSASETAMDAVSASEIAMDAVSVSQIAMDAVSVSQTAMDAVSASAVARDAVRNSDLAFDTVAGLNMAVGKFAAGEAGLDPTEFADMDAVAASSTAMDAVSASETAMDAVSASEIAMDAVSASETAMDAVGGSTVGSTLLPTTPFTDVVYTDNRNNVEVLYGLSGATGANEIRQGEDVGADGFLSIDTDDADSGDEVQATWTIDASLVNEMRFEAEWEETDSTADDTFYEIILDGDVIFTSPAASTGHSREDRVIDLSNEAGVVDVTFETQPRRTFFGGRLTLYDNRNTRA